MCIRDSAGAGRHIELVVGGVIPPGDIPILERDGAAAVFLPAQNQLMRQYDFLTFWRDGGISDKLKSDRINDG